MWKFITTRLEREYGALLSGAESVHEGLAHEQSNGDADSHGDHSSANLDPVPIGGDTASLRETGLRGESMIGNPMERKNGARRRTYRNEEEHASDHDLKASTAEPARIHVTQHPANERADGANDIRAAEDIVIRSFVGGIRRAGDDDHDDEIAGLPRLQVGQTTADREERDDDELREERERLFVPGEVVWPVAALDEITYPGRGGVLEGEGPVERYVRGKRGVVRDELTGVDHGGAARR